MNSEAIILLHGLSRTNRCMNYAGKILSSHGYKIINVNYPSRFFKIEELSQKYISQAIEAAGNVEKIHFLTHSMGGILVRDYLSRQNIANLGNVVMLAPPNKGSEIVDKLGRLKVFRYLNGPAGLQLGTNGLQLGPVNFNLGVIAGNKSINPLLSLLFKGDNDGKVSVSSAKVDGMKDFLVAPYSHTFIMQREIVINQALHFIQNCSFK